jgi:hypothetical protein
MQAIVRMGIMQEKILKMTWLLSIGHFWIREIFGYESVNPTGTPETEELKLFLCKGFILLMGLYINTGSVAQW